MAKDPAFLFYSSDFLSGVSDLTMEERGQYITLICLQHQKGRLNKKTISLSLGLISLDVRLKFSEDENGNLFNERLEIEIEKRKKFCESRSNNGRQGGRGIKKEESTSKASVKLAKDVNENRNTKYNFKLKLKEYGFSENLIDEWMQVRKNKKATNTETAFKKFISEVELINGDINKILEYIIEKSWSGFKAEWILTEIKNKNNGKELSKGQHTINAINDLIANIGN